MANVREILKRELTGEEYQRIENMINIIYRNREIRLSFRILSDRIGSKKAIGKLADEYNLSVATIDWIVYKRRKL